jgi:acyl dehydratase
VGAPSRWEQQKASFLLGNTSGALGSGSRGRVLSYAPVAEASLLHFEDLAVGDQYVSPGRTVTEADIVLFAGLSGDYNILHTDAEYMKSSQFGERIAHGLLGLCIQSGLLTRAMPALAEVQLVSLRWKFKGPIKIGDTITARARIAAKGEGDLPGFGVVNVARQLLNQRGEVVQEGEMDHRVRRRV